MLSRVRHAMICSRPRSLGIFRSSRSFTDDAAGAFCAWIRQFASLGLLGWLAVSSVASAQEVVQDETKRGSLVIIGGSERFSHREYWDEIVELAGGPGSRIAVFPTASGDPVKKGGWVISALNKSGADAFL